MYNCKWLLILISFNYCPLLGGELAWTSNVYIKSFVMNSVQVNYCQSVEDMAAVSHSCVTQPVCPNVKPFD